MLKLMFCWLLNLIVFTGGSVVNAWRGYQEELLLPVFEFSGVIFLKFLFLSIIKLLFKKSIIKLKLFFSFFCFGLLFVSLRLEVIDIVRRRNKTWYINKTRLKFSRLLLEWYYYKGKPNSIPHAQLSYYHNNKIFVHTCSNYSSIYRDEQHEDQMNLIQIQK